MVSWKVALALAQARNVCFVFILLGWAVGMYLFWKHRNVYPFQKRDWFLLMSQYVFSIIATVNAFYFNLLYASTCRRESREQQHSDGFDVCFSRDVFRYLYVVCIPLVSWCYAYRGIILLTRTRMHDVLNMLLVVRTTQRLPPHIKSLDDLMNSPWIQLRFAYRADVVRNAVIAMVLIWISLASTLYFTGLLYKFDQQSAISLSNIMILFISVVFMYCAWNLRHTVIDNHGIGRELGHVGLTTFASIIAYTAISSVAPRWSEDVEIGNFFHVVIWSLLLYLSMVRLLLMVEKPLWQATHTVSQAKSVPMGRMFAGSVEPPKVLISPASDVRSTGYNLQTQNFMKNNLPQDMELLSVIDSKQGFAALHAFLQREFATENLAFVNAVQGLRKSIHRLLRRIELQQLSIPGGSVSSRTLQQLSKNSLDSPKVANASSKSSSSPTITGTFPGLDLKEFCFDDVVDEVQDATQRTHTSFVDQLYQVHKSFLSVGCIQEVNLSSRIRTEVKRAICIIKQQTAAVPARRYYDKTTPVQVFNDPNERKFIELLLSVYDVPFRDIIGLITQNSYPRFRSSQQFRDLEAQVKSRREVTVTTVSAEVSVVPV